MCNLTAGSTNPREIRRLLDAGADVVQHDTLHGKVYLFRTAAVVGSSNASANGLSLQGPECDNWEETNVFATDRSFLDQTAAWFERVHARGRSIARADLNAAEDAWTRRRRHIPAGRTGATTLLDALRADPNTHADRRLYLAVFTSYMNDAGEKALAKVRTQVGAGRELSGYQDWDDMPDDADLISFYSGPRGGCRFDGYWHTLAKHEKLAVGRKSKVTLCWRIKNGDYPPPGQLTDWAGIIGRIKETDDWDNGALIEIGKLFRDLAADVASA